MKFLIAISIFCLPMLAIGQYDPSPKDPKPRDTDEEVLDGVDPRLKEDLIITKISPFDYVAPACKLSADVEFRPRKGRVAYQVGAGLLPNFSVSTALLTSRPWGKLFDHSIGGMVRAEARMYLKSSKVTYLSAGIELDYRFIRTETTLGFEKNGGEPIPVAESIWDIFGWNQFDNVNDTYAYFQLVDMNFHRISASPGFTVGQARVFRNRFSFEWYVGIRMQVSRVFSVDQLPAESEVVSTNAATGWNMTTNHLLVQPSSDVGVRFGWAFKKKTAPRD